MNIFKPVSKGPRRYSCVTPEHTHTHTHKIVVTTLAAGGIQKTESLAKQLDIFVSLCNKEVMNGPNSTLF